MPSHGTIHLACCNNKGFFHLDLLARCYFQSTTAWQHNCTPYSERGDSEVGYQCTWGENRFKGQALSWGTVFPPLWWAGWYTMFRWKFLLGQCGYNMGTYTENDWVYICKYQYQYTLFLAQCWAFCTIQLPLIKLLSHSHPDIPWRRISCKWWPSLPALHACQSPALVYFGNLKCHSSPPLWHHTIFRKPVQSQPNTNLHET